MGKHKTLQLVMMAFVLVASLLVPSRTSFAQADEPDWVLIEVQKIKLLHAPWLLNLKGVNLKAVVVPLPKEGQGTQPSIYNQKNTSISEGEEVDLNHFIVGVEAPSSSDTVDFRVVGVDTDLSPDDLTLFNRELINYVSGQGQSKVSEFLKIRPGGFWSAVLGVVSDLGLNYVLDHISRIGELNITLNRNEDWDRGSRTVISSDGNLEFTYEVRVASAAPPSVDQQVIRLEDTEWTGSYRRSDGIYGGRTATWIYGTSTDYSSMQTSFALDHQPTGTGTFLVEGMDSEDPSKTLISISVNETEIYRGPNPLPDDNAPLASVLTDGNWGNYTWSFDASLLHPGTNTISISNLSDGNLGLPPFFMLDYGVLTYNLTNPSASTASRTYQVMIANEHQPNLTLESIAVTADATALSFSYKASKDEQIFINPPGNPDAFYLTDRDRTRRYNLRTIQPADTAIELHNGDTYRFTLTFDRIDDDVTTLNVIEGQHTESGYTYWDFDNVELK